MPFTPSQIDELPAKEPDYIHSYGDHPKQKVYIRLTDQLAPIVILLHGGCWQAKYAQAKNTQALADAIRDQGYHTCNIEYRSVDEEGGGWPGTFLDVAQGVDCLHDLPYGDRFDFSKTVIYGHSSGGHFAFWLAARQNLPSESQFFAKQQIPFKGVISAGGCTDMAYGFDAHCKSCGQKPMEDLFGGSPSSKPENYAEGNPAQMLPIHCEQLFLSGEADHSFPSGHIENYARLAHESQTKWPVENRVLSHCGHHEYNAPETQAFSILIAEIQRMVKKSL